MTTGTIRAKVSSMKKILLVVGAVVVVLGVGILLRKRAGGAAEIEA